MLGFVWLALAGCAPSTPQSTVASSGNQDPALELAAEGEHLLRLLAERAVPDSILPMFTDSSILWMKDMEQAAAYDSRETLEARPFHELITVIAIRQARRSRVVDRYQGSFLAMSADQRGLLRYAMTLPELGPWKVRGNKGWRGLSSSPLVPVLQWTREGGRWHFDLLKTMPVMARGMESIALKKDWSYTRTALYLVGRAYHQDLSESLLDPMEE